MTGTHERCRSLPADLGARLPGQLQVQQHQVGAVAVEFGDGVDSVVHDLHLEPFLAQQIGQRVAERLFVLDN